MTTAHHPDTAGSLFAAMSPSERQHFKDAYRRDCAVDAGANPAQLVTLTALEEDLDSHYPIYRKRQDGTVHVTYFEPVTGLVTAHVHPDGAAHVLP